MLVMNDSITRGISIQVESQYLPNHSRPEENAYFFAYHVTIKNNSDRSVQLVSRHWIIMNADGKKNEVRGEGVVGQQPILPLRARLDIQVSVRSTRRWDRCTGRIR